MNYALYLLKRQIEDIFIFPFIVLGKIISRLAIKARPFDILFIFPFYHTGGAEKVHSLIAQTFKDRNCLILFTRKSQDDRYLNAFKASGHQIIDISTYTDNKFMYWNNLIYRGIVSALVNTQTNLPIVFNGQSNFGYKLSPWINKKIEQIELLHAFCSFSWIRIPFLHYFSNTIMISRFAIEEHRQQYIQLGIPDVAFKRISHVTNGIRLPKTLIRNQRVGSALKILYVGRATEEKRVNLLATIAKQIATENSTIQFSMVGDLQKTIDPSLHHYIHFYGPVYDENELFNIYLEHDVLMMASSQEGFPISIMESMAAGCVIISTPVGDIPYHVKQGVNGYLFSSIEDEATIIKEAVSYVQQIQDDSDLQFQMSKVNQEYAQKEFELSIFESRYKALLEPSN